MGRPPAGSPARVDVNRGPGRPSAQPGGTTTSHAYETLRDELLDDIRRAMPLDMVLLGLHGAMVADGYDDC